MNPTEPKPQTPLTDAVKRHYHSRTLNAESYEYVYADFARSLELKLQEAEARVKDLESNNRQQLAEKTRECEEYQQGHREIARGIKEALGFENWPKRSETLREFVRLQVTKVIDQRDKACAENAELKKDKERKDAVLKKLRVDYNHAWANPEQPNDKRWRLEMLSEIDAAQKEQG